MDNKRNILALDLATKTGWATNLPCREGGVVNFDSKRGDSPGVRFLRFSHWLKEIIGWAKPNLVVYEQAHHRGGAATELAVGYSTHMQSVLTELDIEYASCHTGTLKKYATGKGNASKDEMVAACRKRYCVEPRDDNHADALHLLAWGEENYG